VKAGRPSHWRPPKNSSTTHEFSFLTACYLTFLFPAYGLDPQGIVADERADMPIIFITGQSEVPMTVQANRGSASSRPRGFPPAS
jgi:hypothetical protein